MKNPLDYVFDWYDYQYQYYRWYLHRRLIFSELSSDSLKKELKYNIFENKDHENVDKLIQQSTTVGFAAGLGTAPIKYLMMTEIQKQPHKRALPVAFGVVVFCSKFFFLTKLRSEIGMRAFLFQIFS
jgi:hypothetical protein